MPDDTAAALQALIQQVTALTETVTEQQSTIDGIKKHNERLLDEKKDLQRKASQPVPPEVKAAMEKAGMEQHADGNWYPKGSTPNHSHTLSRAEARDPAKYRAAKAAAEQAGATLQITDDAPAEDNHRRLSRTETDTTLKTRLVKDEDRRIAYLRRDDMKDAAQYRHLRSDGFTVQSWDQASDLPDHMQTKLALMEKAHEVD